MPSTYRLCTSSGRRAPRPARGRTHLGRIGLLSILLQSSALMLVAQTPPQPPANLRIVRTATGDTVAPSVAITAPEPGATISGNVTITATASDDVAVAGVQFYVDGSAIGVEDGTAPYAASWDTVAAGNGAHTITARARDAAGNQTTSAAVTATVSNAAGGLQISDVSAADSVPRHEKLEITFQVTGSVAANLQMPYDPNPPAGIPVAWGITVNAQFSDDGFQTSYTIPAFHYQYYEYQAKGNRDWFNPLDQYAWKVRFAPPHEGTWQYRLTATDASGSVMSPVGTFSVVPSSNPGFIRVSSRDSRYFEFDDGRPFPGLGYNGGIDWFNPVRFATTRFAVMGQNGIDLSRIWLTQSAIFGSAWNPWYGLRGDYGGYIPRTGLATAGTPARIRLRLTYAEDASGNKNTGYYEACRFIGGFQSATAVKRNTNYNFSVRYSSLDITGPRNPSFPNYGFVLKMQNPADGNWHTNCYEPGVANNTGLVISPYGGNSSAETVIEGDWNSGGNDYLPPFYLALENVRATNPATGRRPAVYISSVEIRERRPDGTLTGPNIVPKPSMEHQTYFEQRFSFAFDRVLEAARENGVYLKVVILEKDEDILSWLDSAGNFGAANSNNFYGDYRNVTAVRWLQQAWWRYLQARWGYSPNVHSWELVNEGDPSNDRHYTLTDELGNYMRQFAPNQHLVTTSFWHSLPTSAFWKSSSYPSVDYADLHAYVSTSQTSEFNAAAAKDAVVRARCGTDNSCFRNAMKNDAALYHSEHSLQASARALGKPLIRGEGGLDAPTAQVEDAGLTADTSGVWLHNFIWSTLDSGAMYDLYWWTNNILRRPGPDGSTANGLQELFGPLRDFLADVPLSSGSYQDLAATVSRGNDVRVLGQRDLVAKRAHAWIQNRRHIWCAVVGGVADCPYTWDGSRLSGTVTIPGFAPSTGYALQWLYFDGSGNPTQPAPATATSDGAGNIVLDLGAVPASVTDAAVKVGSYQ